MKRKIHKNARPFIQKMYEGLIQFYEFDGFLTCKLDSTLYPLFRISPKKKDQGYEIQVFYSENKDDLQIIPIENQEDVMLRIYNTVCDAFKLLNGSGSMETFLGVPPKGQNQERHVWISVKAIEEEV